MPRKRKSKIVALIIFAVIVVILFFISITERVGGQEELMWCDGCKKSVKMDYGDGVFTEVHLIYEWED